MSALLAVDPGARHMGWAVWVDGLLRGSGRHDFDHPLAQVPGWAKDMHRAAGGFEAVVVERMETTAGRARRGDANDLLAVELTAGMLVGTLHPAEALHPTAREWKGQVPKAIHHRRIIATLNEIESMVLASVLDLTGNARHRGDIIDAVGLGLWALGRKLKEIGAISAPAPRPSRRPRSLPQSPPR